MYKNTSSRSEREESDDSSFVLDLRLLDMTGDPFKDWVRCTY